jgi:hypothetical protein
MTIDNKWYGKIREGHRSKLDKLLMNFDDLAYILLCFGLRKHTFALSNYISAIYFGHHGHVCEYIP